MAAILVAPKPFGREEKSIAPGDTIQLSGPLAELLANLGRSSGEGQGLEPPITDSHPGPVFRFRPGEFSRDFCISPIAALFGSRTCAAIGELVFVCKLNGHHRELGHALLSTATKAEWLVWY
jgi:hypothetical protein